MQKIDKSSTYLKSETRSPKKRKMGERRMVVAVKIGGNDKKQQKSEGPPSDCWSWRKYGQKPIKGSPYPRGYYRCSTSKGCSAKKQVERCKTDASLLIITYTSTHNHPHPGSADFSSIKEPEEEEEVDEDDGEEQKEEIDSVLLSVPTDTHPTTPEQEEEVQLMKQKDQTPATKVGTEDQSEQDEEVQPTKHKDQTPGNKDNTEDHFHYCAQSPFNSSQEQIIDVGQENGAFAERIDTVLHNQDPQPFLDHQEFSTSVLEPGENDFYDELEELPTSSFFTAFMMRSSFSEERVLVNPS